MPFRPIRVTPLATFAASALLAVAAWRLAPVLVGREFRVLELVFVAAAVAGLLEWRRRRKLRREREQIENLRDSALW